MKKDLLKQKLTASDFPNPRPASTLDIDFSHASATFRPGAYTKEDIPDELPGFERKDELPAYIWKNDSRRAVIRFSKPLLYDNKRSVSMPTLGKALPPPPVAATAMAPASQRPVSSYIRPGLQDFGSAVAPACSAGPSDGLHAFGSAVAPACSAGPSGGLQPPASLATHQSTPEANWKSRNIIVDSDDDLDSLFSTYNSPNASPHHSKTASDIKYSNMYKPILDVVQTYIPSDDSESILSSNFCINSSLTGIEQLNSSGSLVEATSFEDSLFEPEISSIYDHEPQPSKSPRHRQEYIPVSSYQFNDSFPSDNKSLPPTPASQSPCKLLPPQSSNISALSIPKSRGPKAADSAQATCLTSHNFSSCTSVSTFSLQDSKRELKQIARQRPFSYCLDSGKDYEISRYRIPKTNNKEANSSTRAVTGLPRLPEAKYEVTSQMASPKSKKESHWGLRYSSAPTYINPTIRQPVTKQVLKLSENPRIEHTQSKDQPSNYAKNCTYSTSFKNPYSYNPTKDQNKQTMQTRHESKHSLGDSKEKHLKQKVKDLVMNSDFTHSLRRHSDMAPSKQKVSEKSLPPVPLSQSRQNRFERC